VSRWPALGACLLAAACGGSSGASSSFFDLPTALSLGGPVLSAPRVQALYLPGFPYDADLETFLARLPASRYWPAVASEYGAGALTVLSGYASAVTVPASLTSDDLPGLLDAVLAEGAAKLGPPRADTIYVLFFDPATSITVTGQVLCSPNAPAGFHDEWTVGGVSVPAVVIPTCSSFFRDSTLTGANVLTPAVSHELVEAATDPFPRSAPAFRGLDTEHALWGEAIGGAEVADLCANETPNLIVPDDVGYPVQRVWSNTSAGAGTGPCVPVPTGEIYFNCVASLPARAQVTNQDGTTFMVPALAAPVGRPATAQVAFRGGNGVPATWRAVAIEIDNPGGEIGATPTPVTGMRGQIHPVDIAFSSTPASGVLPLLVGASDGTALHLWVGAIDRN
jgi:hypothetical protein